MIFAEVTASSAISLVPTALAAIVGFGYVPLSEPPAGPLGAIEVGAFVIFV